MSTNEPSPLIPDLFHEQKNYIFRALEQDAFPRFLRAKAFGNLTPLGSFVRLIAGLLCLWGAFVLAFSLIFLDHKPKRDRLWVSIYDWSSLTLGHFALFHRHELSLGGLLFPLAFACLPASERDDAI